MLFSALLGTVIFFIVFTENPSAAKIFRFGEANNTELENIILQRQIDELIPQLPLLNVHVIQLHEYSHKLDQLLFRQMMPGDTIPDMTIEAKTFRIQSMLYASTVLKQ